MEDYKIMQLAKKYNLNFFRDNVDEIVKLSYNLIKDALKDIYQKKIDKKYSKLIKNETVNIFKMYRRAIKNTSRIFDMPKKSFISVYGENVFQNLRSMDYINEMIFHNELFANFGNEELLCLEGKLLANSINFSEMAFQNAWLAQSLGMKTEELEKIFSDNFESKFPSSDLGDAYLVKLYSFKD